MYLQFFLHLLVLNQKTFQRAAFLFSLCLGTFQFIFCAATQLQFTSLAGKYQSDNDCTDKATKEEVDRNFEQAGLGSAKRDDPRREQVLDQQQRAVVDHEQ